LPAALKQQQDGWASQVLRGERKWQLAPVTGHCSQREIAVRVDGTQQATSTTYEEVPYSVDYGIFTLYVESPQGNGDVRIQHTFQQKGLYSQIYGIPLGGRGHHPGHAVIEDAVKWMSAGGLSDPNQGSVLVPDQAR
jgi:hypothetical protein